MITAVVVYDWILTFPDEMRLIWRHRWTGAKALFLLNRYLIIVFFVTAIPFDQLSGSDNAVSVCD